MPAVAPALQQQLALFDEFWREPNPLVVAPPKPPPSSIFGGPLGPGGAPSPPPPPASDEDVSGFVPGQKYLVRDDFPDDSVKLYKDQFFSTHWIKNTPKGAEDMNLAGFIVQLGQKKFLMNGDHGCVRSGASTCPIAQVKVLGKIDWRKNSKNYKEKQEGLHDVYKFTQTAKTHLKTCSRAPPNGVCYNIFTEPGTPEMGARAGQDGWMPLRALRATEGDPMGRKILDETREIEVDYDADAKSQALKAQMESEQQQVQQINKDLRDAEEETQKLADIQKKRAAEAAEKGTGVGAAAAATKDMAEAAAKEQMMLAKRAAEAGAEMTGAADNKNMALNSSKNGAGPPMLVLFPMGEPVVGHFNRRFF